ncbi:MAG TPA: hypothetical protein VF062_16580 [Candidatus Limnocylindrales bacterium]
MKKILKNPFFLLLLGLLCIYLSFAGASDGVTCNDVPMKPGDTCGSLSYEDKQRSADIFKYGLIGLGLVLVLYGVVTITRKRKK